MQKKIAILTTHRANNFGAMLQAVSLATTAPSACNRQQIRVKCIENTDIIKEILFVQGGARGFGHLADKVLIITSDIHYEFTGKDRCDAYINGGIFIMNLCYSLHYYGIAHCILTWAVDQAKDIWLREKCVIPDNEVVIALLCCGNAAEKFKVPTSPRREIGEVFSMI